MASYVSDKVTQERDHSSHVVELVDVDVLDVLNGERVVVLALSTGRNLGNRGCCKCLTTILLIRDVRDSHLWINAKITIRLKYVNMAKNFGPSTVCILWITAYESWE